MNLKVIIIAYLFQILCLLPLSLSTDPKPQNSTSVSHDVNYSLPNHQPTNLRTDELINQQSENIRHIIATEQRNLERGTQDLPKQLKKEKAIVTIEDERFPTLEELRTKCQHFSRLFGSIANENKPLEPSVKSDTIERYSSTATPIRTEYFHRPIIEVTRRPVFIRNKPTFIERGNGGFYVTASTSTGNYLSTSIRPYMLGSTTHPRVSYTPADHITRYITTTAVPSTTTRSTTPSTSTQKIETIADTTSTTGPPKIKIKYTKFEPVILQKTILTDGRVMYHWHRSLPTTAVDLPAPIAPLPTPIFQSPTYEYPSITGMKPMAQRNLGLLEPNTEEAATSSTTTTEKSNWLFVPFSNLFGGGASQAESTTTTESTTVPSTTISTTTTEKTEVSTSSKIKSVESADDETHAQLKLVVPVQYDDIDASLSLPYNRQGYYRKTAGTSLPSLQVIKTMGIPQNIPRYTLGYTGTGYGLTFNNGLSYGGTYSPEYMNYGSYGKYPPLEHENVKLDDVTI